MDEWTAFREEVLRTRAELARLREHFAHAERTLLESRLAIATSRQVLKRWESTDQFLGPSADPRRAA